MPLSWRGIYWFPLVWHLFPFTLSPKSILAKVPADVGFLLVSAHRCHSRIHHLNLEILVQSEQVGLMRLWRDLFQILSLSPTCNSDMQTIKGSSQEIECPSTTLVSDGRNLVHDHILLVEVSRTRISWMFGSMFPRPPSYTDVGTGFFTFHLVTPSKSQVHLVELWKSEGLHCSIHHSNQFADLEMDEWWN